MARLFDDAQQEYLYIASPVITAYPFAMVVRFYSDDNSVLQNLIWCGDKDVDDYWTGLRIRGDQGGKALEAISHNYGGAAAKLAITTSGFSADTWHHAAGIWLATDERHAYLDGGSKGSNYEAVGAMVNHDATAIASARDSTPGSYVSGKMAEVAMWDLTDWGANDAEREVNFEKVIASLAKGFSPKFFPLGLRAYWPLVKNDNDVKGAFNLTPINTPSWDTHCRILVPQSAIIGRPPGIQYVSGTASGSISFTATASAKNYNLATATGSFEFTATAAGKVLKTAIASGSIEFTATAAGTVISTDTVEITISGQGSLDIRPTHTNAFNLGTIIPSPLVPIVPGQNPACDQGSAGNWDEVKPTITLTPQGVGTFEQVVPAAADQNSHAGAGQINSHELPWYGIAHLLPRVVQDLGNIVSDQTVTCELYNADRAETITVSSITDNLGDGIEVSGVPATPFDIASQDSLVFSVLISRTGDLIISGDYTLTLSTGEDYTLYFTGARIVLFPIRPESPLREHLIFDTKIIEAVDGSEQRRANRQYPRGMFEATYKGGQKKIEMLLFDRQSKVIAYPAWHEPAYLDGAHSIDDLTVTVNTTDYANFFVGGYAVVLRDENYFDALKIESMTATTITFESGLTYDYATKTQVMPLFTAYVEASSASLKYPYNQQYFNLRIHVHPEINDIADDSAWNVYDSKPFMDAPNMIEGGQLAEALRTKVFVIDNLTGLRTPVTAWDHNKRYSKKGWKTNSRQELWELRQLLHFLRGRQVSFYIPTFWKDLVITDTMAIGTYVLNMDNIGYTINARQRWPKQFIRVIFKDGSILVSEIVDSVQVSEVQEQLTLDDSWPATYEPDEVERVEFLEKVRLDVDDIIVIHYNALGQSECIVPIKEVE